MTKVIYVTQEWLEALQNELKNLKEVKNRNCWKIERSY